MPDLDAIFGTTASISWAQECARAVLILAYGIVAVRVAGRRLFGKWSALDFVVSVIVGSNLSRALTGNAPLWGTLAATTLLLALHWLLARGTAQWGFMSRMLEGSAIHLARDGEVEAKLLKRNLVSEADLNEAIRSEGLNDTDPIKELVLEPSGTLSILRKS